VLGGSDRWRRRRQRRRGLHLECAAAARAACQRLGFLPAAVLVGLRRAADQEAPQQYRWEAVVVVLPLSR